MMDEDKRENKSALTKISRGLLIILLVGLVGAIGRLGWGIFGFGIKSCENGVCVRAADLYFGENEGMDAPDVPRPPHAIRQSMMRPGNGKFPMVLYRSDLSVEDVARYYTETMPAKGWVTENAFRDGEEDVSHRLLSYSNRKGVSCNISILAAEDGGTSVDVILSPAALPESRP